MAKNNNLKDFLIDLYEGIASKKPNASRNPQDFRSEIESIGEGSYEVYNGAFEGNAEIVVGGNVEGNTLYIDGTIDSNTLIISSGSVENNTLII